MWVTVNERERERRKRIGSVSELKANSSDTLNRCKCVSLLKQPVTVKLSETPDSSNVLYRIQFIILFSE